MGFPNAPEAVQNTPDNQDIKIARASPDGGPCPTQGRDGPCMYSTMSNPFQLQTAVSPSRSITPLMSKPAALSNARSKKRSLVRAPLSPRSSRYNCVELCLCWPLAFKFTVHLVCHGLLESRCLGCVHALMFLHVTYRSALCSASCRWLSSSCLARFSACSSSNGKRALDSTRNPQCPQ